jgi:hypothetical protein
VIRSREAAMGKAARWLRSILTGKKQDDCGVRGARTEGKKALPPPATGAHTAPREKKRWSSPRPSSAAQGRPLAPVEQKPPSQSPVMAAAAVPCLKEKEEERDVLLARWLVEQAAAARIQATFRGYLVSSPAVRQSISCLDTRTYKFLSCHDHYPTPSCHAPQARKALCALRGLVKLQALVRGQLVRRQADATLRRMQALVSAAQSRLRVQAQQRVSDRHDLPLPTAAQRRSPQHPRRRSSYVRAPPVNLRRPSSCNSIS